MTKNNQDQLNVLGEKIEVCSCAPMTGWFRDGFCNYDKNDGGNHSICCVMDDNFLKYSDLLYFRKLSSITQHME